MGKSSNPTFAGDKEFEKIHLKEKFSYGLGDVACNVVYALTTSLLIYFYTNVVGISAAMIGTIMLFSRFFDGISDVLIGHLVDRTHSKHGKSRAWILWMMIPYGIAAILLFTVIVILPVFVDVYHGLTGNLTAGSFGYVNASIIIGWIALGVTLLCTVLVVLGVLAGRSAAGRQRLLRLFEKAPLTRGPMRQMAVSRFTAALATFVAAGVDTDTAMEKAVAMVDHGNLKSQLEAVRMQMTDPAQAKSLAQAIFDNNVFEPIYARMLVVGTRSGSLETVLASLSDTFFDDSIVRLDGLIDSVEPTLAAFLTVGVGATLIAVMLPLIGIMGSIG